MPAPRVLLSTLLLGLCLSDRWQSASVTAAGLAGAVVWPPTELTDNASCANAGVDPARHMVRVVLPNRYNATAGGTTVFAPIYTSLPLVTEAESPPADRVTHAIILVHGLAGNANAYFCDGVAAAAASGAGDTTIVVAPWFGSQQVTAAQWSAAGSPRPHGTMTSTSFYSPPFVAFFQSQTLQWPCRTACFRSCCSTFRAD